MINSKLGPIPADNFDEVRFKPGRRGEVRPGVARADEGAAPAALRRKKPRGILEVLAD
jgi:hypothetical protein